MGKGASIAVLCAFALGGFSGFVRGEEPSSTPEAVPADTSPAAPESHSAETGKAKSFSHTYTYTHRAAEPPRSRLSDVSPEDLKKTAELDHPVTVEILSTARKVEGLTNIADRLVDVRITNPNPYALFFPGRRYLGNVTAKLTWKAWKDGQWVKAGSDWCGTGVQDWVIPPGASTDVLLWLAPNLGSQQQLLSTFYRLDKPSVQSDCLLYEHK